MNEEITCEERSMGESFMGALAIEFIQSEENESKSEILRKAIKHLSKEEAKVLVKLLNKNGANLFSNKPCDICNKEVNEDNAFFGKKATCNSCVHGLLETAKCCVCDQPVKGKLYSFTNNHRFVCSDCRSGLK